MPRFSAVERMAGKANVGGHWPFALREGQGSFGKVRLPNCHSLLITKNDHSFRILRFKAKEAVQVRNGRLVLGNAEAASWRAD